MCGSHRLSPSKTILALFFIFSSTSGKLENATSHLLNTCITLLSYQMVFPSLSNSNLFETISIFEVYRLLYFK